MGRKPFVVTWPRSTPSVIATCPGFQATLPQGCHMRRQKQADAYEQEVSWPFMGPGPLQPLKMGTLGTVALNHRVCLQPHPRWMHSNTRALPSPSVLRSGAPNLCESPTWCCWDRPTHMDRTFHIQEKPFQIWFLLNSHPSSSEVPTGPSDMQ